MLEFFKFLWVILLDQRGEDPKPDPEPDPKPEPEPEPKPDPEPEPEPEPEPVENKYEGFDFTEDTTKDEIFAKLKEVSGDHQVLTGKTTKTEKHLAEIRDSLKQSGISVFFDDNGNVKLGAEGKEVEKKPVAKTRRFTEDHQNKFGGYFEEGGDKGKGFLELMTLRIQDIVDDVIEETRTKAAAENKANNEYLQSRATSAQKLVKLFPDLVSKGKDGEANPTYNEAFRGRAKEIYEKEYCTTRESDGVLLETHPNGQLWAAIEASAELGITPTSIEEAKKAGVKIGKDGKKILGKVGKTGPAGAGGKLGQEEYLKLSEEERDAYDRKQVGAEE